MTYLDSMARRRVPRAVVDLVLAVVMVTGGLSEPAQSVGTYVHGLDLWRVLLVLLVGLSLTVHRKWPLPVLAVVVVGLGALQAWHYLPPPVGPQGTTISVPYLALALAVFLTAVRTSPRAATVTIVVLIPATAVAEAVMEPGYRTANAVTTVFLLVAAWALGRLFRARKAMAHEALERAAAVEREQAANARAAVAQERARIARELHDIVAHNVSLMVVQTIAADRVQDRDGAKAHELHRTIEQTGRAAVGELRRLLGVLRSEEQDDDPTKQPPQPTLAEIPRLVESVRTAGLDVEFAVHGSPVELPAGTELVVYRVVQEALTNTLKHAGHTSARLSLDWGAREGLSVRVCDDGRRPGHDVPRVQHAARGTGHGLVGMRERIAAVGGTLHTGEQRNGGFCVHATVPLSASGAEEAVGGGTAIRQ
ncbi:sensor histidine kinase [Streptomyces chromofuscus]|uniref:histidine kinase n=1 Tax=Streptomyces chromofuscus TaxID=42881 RepID=A0A7M2T7P9_STRCW|nr:sensor histidine kinase [Streptomyces chromofuscus]QOV44737.1 sensor histidine kinase [Streptomyces chromofuscus]GGT00690.1 two-component sensor histidine kinase [Streptomyces chromofuscus]